MSEPARNTSVSRRQALRAAAAACAFPVIIPASSLGRGGAVAPSERVTLGVVGTGNQGFNDLRSFFQDDRVQVVAVCDVNRESRGYWDDGLGGREPALRLVDEAYANRKRSGESKGCDA